MTDERPIPMSGFHLAPRYTSEDMYRDHPHLKTGDRFAFERDGVVYTDTIESVSYSSGSPAVYRDLNRWQWFLRRLTPRRWRRSLLVREAEPAEVTINGDQPNPVGRTLAQLEQMKAGFDRLLK